MHNQDNRLVSPDVFRGLTIAGMVLVNNSEDLKKWVSGARALARAPPESNPP